jgi:non-heme chloroperoxidase
MTSRRIAGAHGVQLHAIETGNPNGRPILFIHGFSQCSLAWSRQLGSDLAETYRLVALDLRGHGRSDKPREGYADSGTWAGDIDAVIRDLGLDHPILCGWSYGPLVTLDYVRHHGEDAIGGLVFAGGVTKLGTEEAMAVLTPEFLALVPGFFSSDIEDGVRSLDSLLRLCFAQAPAAEDLYLMLGYNAWVPPWVRQALLSRPLDNDDVLAGLQKPVLIAHGDLDAVVRPVAADQHQARIAGARVAILRGAGHACFCDDAPAFNQALRSFADAL